MSQKELGRIHLTLRRNQYAEVINVARHAATVNPRIGVGNVIVAMVHCALPKLEEKLPKAFTLSKIRVDPEDPMLEGEKVKVHLYFGQHYKLIPKLEKLAKKTRTSVSWLVRASIALCLPTFEKHVKRGRSFKCLGELVTFKED